MANFTVRVELHKATDEDYEKLHEAMEAKGFSRLIVGSDDVVYHLPPAEYDYSGDDTISEVHDKAKSAARAVKQKFAVLVTQGKQMWSGLEPVEV